MAHSNMHSKVFSAGHALKLMRVAISVVMLFMCVAMLTYTSAWVADTFRWLPRIQIVPLALSSSATGLLLWLGATLIFGRIYCSSVCPMGTLQDIFAHLRRLTRSQRRHHPFHHTQPNNRLRYILLTTIAGSGVAGMSLLISISDPYSAFARICSQCRLTAANLIAGNPVAAATWLAFAIAMLTLLAVAWFSFRHGRIICNTVCPVGSALGIFSRYPLLHFDIDTDHCVNCRKCEHECKSGCIDLDAHLVDASRCVVCFNCLQACDSKAIRYTHRRKHLALPMLQRIQPTPSPFSAPDTKITGHNSLTGNTTPQNRAVKIDRRRFLATGLIVAATPAVGVLARAADRFAAAGSEFRPIHLPHAVVPPGRRNMQEFLERCTGCGMCISQCPSKVLRPSANQLGWLRMLHPVMDYDAALCLYDCTRCTEVCPTGALYPLTADEKHIFIIGHAVTEPANCTGCFACVQACPRKAIAMIRRPDPKAFQSAHIPKVDTSLCIGCGACQNVCPAYPYKAIGVNGII